jgi:hypothetical protein
VVTRFSRGEHVVIRYGRHQGQRATVIRTQPGNVYLVKAEDGSVLFFSDKGLAKAQDETSQSEKPRWQNNKVS